MRRLVGKIVVGAVAVAVTAVVAPFALADDKPSANNDPGHIQVYTNNIENLPTVNLKCPGDWQDLYYYMQLQSEKPDVYLVQQVSGQDQLSSLVKRMESDFGDNYAGVIADKTPKRMNSPCGPPKDYQTTAVIYRTERFSAIKTDHNSWQAQVRNSAGDCVNNTQARTQAVKVQLRDKVAEKTLTAASIHWATKASGGPPCAKSNAAEVAAELTEDGYGGSLLIAGGDFNYDDVSSGTNYRGWYKAMNGDLGGRHGFRDPVYDACASSGSVGECLADNWTIGGDRRIDFMFAKRSNGMAPVSAAHTVTFNEGDAADEKLTGTDRGDRDYSDHRSVRARIHY